MDRGDIMKERLKHVGTFKDEDGTLKAVYEAKNGILETTLLVNKHKQDKGIDVFCVPTHHYCSLGCTFCHLTADGAPKSMVPVEKDDLIEAIIRTSYKGCKPNGTKNDQRNYKNLDGVWCTSGLISFMGSGEPLLNLETIMSVFENQDTISSKTYYSNLSYALASMMPNRNLEKLSKYAFRSGMPLKVHFSMHSPFDDERQKIVPKAGPCIEEVLSMISSYRENVTKVEKIRENLILFHGTEDPTEIHYTLIKDVNDTPRHLDRFVGLADKYSIPVKFLEFNPIGGMQASERANEWIESLRTNVRGLKVRTYASPGKNIGSSCGAFTKHFYLPQLETEEEKTKFEQWKKKHEIFEDNKVIKINFKRD